MFHDFVFVKKDNFLDIHVCHCLNSKAQGVNSDSRQPIDPNTITSQSCLFVDNYLSKSVYKMIQFNYLVTHWVASEVLMADNVKVNWFYTPIKVSIVMLKWNVYFLKNQANTIMKFLKVAKKCYEFSNFSSSFSIYDGLQDITIRNLPAWQYVSSKSIHTMEKISSFKVFKHNFTAKFNYFKESYLIYSYLILSYLIYELKSCYFKMSL
jgi:hypothetical protein